MENYYNLVSHEKKIICEACKCRKDGALPKVKVEHLRLLPLFFEYCANSGLEIEVWHDASVDSGELYQNGYQDFKDIYKELIVRKAADTLLSPHMFDEWNEKGESKMVDDGYICTATLRPPSKEEIEEKKKKIQELKDSCTWGSASIPFNVEPSTATFHSYELPEESNDYGIEEKMQALHKLLLAAGFKDFGSKMKVIWGKVMARIFT